jgi:Ca-activated chloride channel family protein
MLAEDRPPDSRLDRAKDYLIELSQVLQKRGGYRVGLVGFAGQSRILAELSDDYDSFRYAVNQAHPDLLGVQERIGYKEDGLSFGTSLRAALEQALAVHDPEFRGFQEILLISDGDDLAGDWRIAVKEAQKAGVPVSTLGVGDPFRDAFIPTGDRDSPYVVYEGQRVRTRRQDRILREIGNATGGLFLGEEESSQPAAFWFQTEVAKRPAREWEAHRRPLPADRSGWFLGAAFILLVLELAFSDRRREP